MPSGRFPKPFPDLLTPGRKEGRSPFFVEFLGMPGSGKSTVAHEVDHILAARGYRVADRPSLVTGTASRLHHALKVRWFRMTHLRLRSAGLMYALSVRPLRFSRLRQIRQALFLAYYLEQMKRSSAQVVLMSQSVLNALWAAAIPGHQIDERKLERFLSHILQELSDSHAFVAVDVPASTAAERVVERGRPGSRFDALPYEEAADLLSRHQDTMRLVLDCALRSTGAPVFRVDGTAASAENALSIADFIESVLPASALAARTLGRSSPRAKVLPG